MKRARKRVAAANQWQRVKASDVAREAKVSTSAVSRVFTEGASVAPETRARVLLAANALGYRPNALARGLITQRTRLVAVIMGNLHSPFFSDFLDNLNSGLERLGFSMLLILLPDRAQANEALERARDYGVQGAVFMSTGPTAEVAARAEATGIPLVILDLGRNTPKTSSSVWIDAQSIGRRVAERFIAERRQRPLAISALTSPQPAEIAAFNARLTKAGFTTGKAAAGWTYADGLEVGRELFGRRDHPDAVFATTGALACGLYDAATKIHGLKTPEAVSIVGVGDLPQADWMSYGISAVRLPIPQLAEAAVNILAKRIANAKEPVTRALIDCEIIWRRTTLPPSRGALG